MGRSCDLVSGITVRVSLSRNLYKIKTRRIYLGTYKQGTHSCSYHIFGSAVNKITKYIFYGNKYAFILFHGLDVNSIEI